MIAHAAGYRLRPGLRFLRVMRRQTRSGAAPENSRLLDGGDMNTAKIFFSRS